MRSLQADAIPALLSADDRALDPGGEPATERLVQRLMRARSEFGITRVGSITRLDRVGVPVVQVVRPLARSNAVSQGKGLSLAEAAASALMEALETWAGEHIAEDRLARTSPVSLGGDGELYRPWLRGDATGWDLRHLTWLEGWDLLAARARPVPLALVDTDYTVPSPHPDMFFARTTTGLGAGTTLMQAVLKGCTEVLERHVLAQARRNPRFFDACLIDRGTVEEPLSARLLRLIEAAGLLAGIWRVPGPESMPVYFCHIMETPGGGAVVPLPAEGSACDFTQDAALAKALMEACQARLTAISGAREDLTRKSYPDSYDRAQLAEWAEHLRSSGRGARAFAVDGTMGHSLGSPLRRVLEALRAEGARAVIAVPLLASEVLGVHVVRVLAPPLDQGA